MVRKAGGRRGKRRKRGDGAVLAGVHQSKWMGGQKSSLGGKGMRERTGKNTGGERRASLCVREVLDRQCFPARVREAMKSHAKI